MIDRKAPRVAANLVTGWVSNGEKRWGFSSTVDWFFFCLLRQILKDAQVFLISWKCDWWIVKVIRIDSWRGCISLLAVMLLSVSLLLKEDETSLWLFSGLATIQNDKNLLVESCLWAPYCLLLPLWRAAGGRSQRLCNEIKTFFPDKVADQVPRERTWYNTASSNTYERRLCRTSF